MMEHREMTLPEFLILMVGNVELCLKCCREDLKSTTSVPLKWSSRAHIFYLESMYRTLLMKVQFT